MKIVIYGICKNEKDFAKRFMESTKGADGVYVCDTGSTDGTQEILKSYGAFVEDISVVPFRFDLARNMALLHVPKDADIAISMDLDDVLLPDWRETVEKYWVPGITTVMNYPYTHAWADTEQTIPRITIFGFKIHCPKSYIWHYPIHEITEIIPGIQENIILSEKPILMHYPDLTRQERQNRIHIFEMFKDDYKDDLRMIHLYGRELFFQKRYKEAISILKDYLKKSYINENKTLDNDAAVQSRSLACRWIAECLESEKPDNYAEILQWHLRSVSESPFQREPWMHLAYLWYRLGDGHSAYAAVKKGLEVTEKLNSIELEGHCWNEQAEQLLTITKMMMERQEKPYTNNIEGWMTEEELIVLNSLAKQMESIIEVGSWKGRSTHALLSSCKGLVYAVDHFEGTVSDGDAHKEAFDDKEAVYKQFMKNVGFFPNLKVLKDTSESAALTLENEKVDMVFIDAEHTFEAVRKDIDMWYPKAKKIICGHDYNFPDIKKAVDAAFTNVEVVGSIWIYKIPQDGV